VELKPGARLRSQVCDTEVVVIRPPSSKTDLRCGGSPMVPLGSGGERNGKPKRGFDEGTELGKRYALADDSTGVELLVTRAGEGALSIGDTVLTVKAAKPLPSSD
jgi:hypothetical protein